MKFNLNLAMTMTILINGVFGLAIFTTYFVGVPIHIEFVVRFGIIISLFVFFVSGFLGGIK